MIPMRFRTSRLAHAASIGVAALLLAPSVFADAFDPPPTYYDAATGAGATLKQQLHEIIEGHTVRSYGDARSILQDLDRDPADPDRILLVYDRASLDVSSINPNGSIPGWDSGSSWNREHTWPRSRGVGSSGADNSDLHQLRPSDPGVNGSRGISTLVESSAPRVSVRSWMEERPSGTPATPTPG